MNNIVKEPECLKNIFKPTVEGEKQELVCALADLIRKHAVQKMIDTN